MVEIATHASGRTKCFTRIKENNSSKYFECSSSKPKKVSGEEGRRVTKVNSTKNVLSFSCTILTSWKCREVSNRPYSGDITTVCCNLKQVGSNTEKVKNMLLQSNRYFGIREDKNVCQIIISRKHNRFIAGEVAVIEAFVIIFEHLLI